MSHRTALAGLLFLASLPAAAQPQLTAEQQLDRGLVNLGLMSAHAFQCTPEADRAEFQRLLLAFNARLLADVGGNAAFRFATAFGAGTATEIDRGRCPQSLGDWRRHVQEHRLDR
jgi:hypothetical protein